MQWRILRNTEIDLQQWNECVKESKSPLIYGHSDFLNIVCPDWMGLVMGNYEAVFPVTLRKKFTFNYLYQPAFMQQGGLFSANPNNIKEALNFLKNKYRFIEINLNYSTPDKDFKQRNNYILSLNKPYSELEKAFAQNHKRNIAKSEAHTLRIKATDIKEIITLFKNNKAQGKNFYSENDYLRLVQLSNLSYGNCMGIFHEDKLIGGALLVEFQGRITFLFSGYDYNFKQYNGMFFLVNSLIKKHASSNMILDFEGSDNENLARFYKGFGSRNQPYYSFKCNNLPAWVRIFKK